MTQKPLKNDPTDLLKQISIVQPNIFDHSFQEHMLQYEKMLKTELAKQQNKKEQTNIIKDAKKKNLKNTSQNKAVL